MNATDTIVKFEKKLPVTHRYFDDYFSKELYLDKENIESKSFATKAKNKEVNHPVNNYSSFNYQTHSRSIDIACRYRDDLK
jgi:hypothetical protein